MNRLWLGKCNPAAPASSGCRCPWMPNKDQLHGNLCTHQPASSLAGESGIGFNLRKEMSEDGRSAFLSVPLPLASPSHGGVCADVNAVLLICTS